MELRNTFIQLIDTLHKYNRFSKGDDVYHSINNILIDLIHNHYDSITMLYESFENLKSILQNFELYQKNDEVDLLLTKFKTNIIDKLKFEFELKLLSRNQFDDEILNNVEEFVNYILLDEKTNKYIMLHTTNNVTYYSVITDNGIEHSTNIEEAIESLFVYYLENNYY